MGVLEEVFTKRGDAQTAEEPEKDAGVFEEVIVRRGRWRKGGSGGSQEGDDPRGSETLLSTPEKSCGPDPSLVIESTPEKTSQYDKSEITYAAPFVVKHTFFNAPVLRSDSLQEFLTDRKVQSCPADGINLDDILDIDGVRMYAPYQAFNTGSSFGDLRTLQQDAVLNTASTFMDTERLQCLPPQQMEPPVASSSSSSKAPLILSELVGMDTYQETVFKTDSTLGHDQVFAADMSVEDRLRSLRQKGSVIQHQMGHPMLPWDPAVAACIQQGVSAMPQPPLNELLQGFQEASLLSSIAMTDAMLLQQSLAHQAQFFPVQGDALLIDAAASAAGDCQVPPPPASAAPGSAVLRLAEAIAPPALGSPECPSIGSLLHLKGECKPCTFFHTRGCENKEDCKFCHLCGPGEKKKRLKHMKAAQREATLVALQNAKHALASYNAAEAANLEVDMIVE
jgi:hypothetical protein